jgi:hypothetical protein
LARQADNRHAKSLWLLRKGRAELENDSVTISRRGVMKLVFLGLALLFAFSARAEFVYLEGYVGQASVNPVGLNNAIADNIWNTTAASPGKFNSLNYMAVQAGLQVFPFIFVGLRYEQVSKELPSGTAGTGKTVQDTFNYTPVILMIEASTPSLFSFVFTGGFGIGTALTYEFHEKYSGTGENITYSDNPMILRARGEVAYMFLPVLGLSFELIYDTIKSSGVTANSDYVATFNGTAIKKGDKFSGVDMSGLRYGVGLRFAF